SSFAFPRARVEEGTKEGTNAGRNQGTREGSNVPAFVRGQMPAVRRTTADCLPANAFLLSRRNRRVRPNAFVLPERNFICESALPYLSIGKFLGAGRPPSILLLWAVHGHPESLGRNPPRCHDRDRGGR